MVSLCFFLFRVRMEIVVIWEDKQHLDVFHFLTNTYMMCDLYTKACLEPAAQKQPL